MATSTLLAAPINTADADFRAWGGGLSAALAALGLVKVYNNIDWTTVVKPAAANTVSGKEVWRFDDADQAAWPLFFSLEYGSGASNQLHPNLWIQVGTTCNLGTGVLGGVLSTRVTLSGAGSSATALNSYISATSSRVSVQMFQGVAQQTSFNMFFTIERIKSDLGQPTSDTYLVTCLPGSSIAPQQQVIPQSGVATAAFTCIFLSPNASNGLYGSDAAIGMIFPQKGRLMPPAFNILNGLPSGGGAVIRGTTVSVTHWGAAHNYLVGWVQWDTNNGLYNMMIWE